MRLRGVLERGPLLSHESLLVFLFTLQRKAHNFLAGIPFVVYGALSYDVRQSFAVVVGAFAATHNRDAHPVAVIVRACHTRDDSGRDVRRYGFFLTLGRVIDGLELTRAMA